MPLSQLEAVTESDTQYETDTKAAPAAKVAVEAPKQAATAEKPAVAKEDAQAEKSEKPGYAVTIQELRADRRELRAEIKKRDEFLQKATERLEKLESARKNGEAKTKPDPNVDPDGYTKAELAELREETTELKKELGVTKQREAEVAQWQTRVKDATEYERSFLDEFVEDHPDYKAAAEFGYAARMADLESMLDENGDDLTAGAKQSAVAKDILMVIERAQKKGKNPAEIIYNFAVKRGYKADADKAEVEEKPAAKKKDTDDLEILAKGQKAARSISKGGSGNKDLTLEDLVAMDDEEFDKLSDRKTVKGLFG